MRPNLQLHLQGRTECVIHWKLVHISLNTNQNSIASIYRLHAQAPYTGFIHWLESEQNWNSSSSAPVHFVFQLRIPHRTSTAQKCKALVLYLCTHIVNQTMKPEYNCLNQGERATNIYLRLSEIPSENTTSPRRCNESRKHHPMH